MKSGLFCVAAALALVMTLPALAAEKVQPVRMGCGMMTFDTVPGWGLRPDGKSALGPTHGGVVIDKAGNIYTSANKGVVVFSPDGKVIQAYLGDKYSNIHDMEIRDEGDGEFIYGARNNNAEGIKFNAQTGEIVLKLPFPEGIGPEPDEVQPDGDHRRSQRRHLSVRRLRQQPHLQVRQDRQVPDALRHEGERPEAVQHGPRHDARHALRSAAAA